MVEGNAVGSWDVLQSNLQKGLKPMLFSRIDRYFKFVEENGYFVERRRRQAQYWMYETIDSELRRRFYDDPERSRRIAAAEQLVLSNRLSPFQAAWQLLES